MRCPFLSLIGFFSGLLLIVGSIADASCVDLLGGQNVVRVDFSKREGSIKSPNGLGSASVTTIVTEAEMTLFVESFNNVQIYEENYLIKIEALISSFMNQLGPGEVRIAVTNELAGRMADYLKASIELIELMAETPTIVYFPQESDLPILEAAQKSIHQLKRLQSPFNKQVARNLVFKIPTLNP